MQFGWWSVILRKMRCEWRQPNEFKRRELEPSLAVLGKASLVRMPSGS